MGCFVVLLGAGFPRIALVITAIFTDRISHAFNDRIALPLLGFLFLPFTTFFYVVADGDGAGVSTIGWLFVALGLLLDLGVLGGGGRERRRRRRDRRDARAARARMA